MAQVMHGLEKTVCSSFSFNFNIIRTNNLDGYISLIINSIWANSVDVLVNANVG